MVGRRGCEDRREKSECGEALGFAGGAEALRGVCVVGLDERVRARGVKGPSES